MKGTIEKGTREKRTKERSGILGIVEFKIPGRSEREEQQK
jgi:hypothetical protein